MFWGDGGGLFLERKGGKGGGWDGMGMVVEGEGSG